MWILTAIAWMRFAGSEDFHLAGQAHPNPEKF